MNKTSLPAVLPGFALPAALMLLIVLSIITAGLIQTSPMQNETQYRRYNQILSDDLSRTGLEAITTILMQKTETTIAADDWVATPDLEGDAVRCSSTGGMASPRYSKGGHFLRFFTRLDQELIGKRTTTTNRQYRVTSCAWSVSHKATSMAINSVQIDYGADGQGPAVIKTYVPY
jgi:Tfp pilus assembly protein PilX